MRLSFLYEHRYKADAQTDESADGKISHAREKERNGVLRLTQAVVLVDGTTKTEE
jgi:hypothetical protein